MGVKSMTGMPERVLEWVYEQAQGRPSVPVGCAAFASASGVTEDTIRDILKRLERQGHIDDWSDFDESCAVLTVTGIELVEESKAKRSNPRLRSAAARNGLILWLYEQTHSGIHYPETDLFLESTYSFFENDHLTRDEVYAAMTHLKSRELVTTVDSAEFVGIGAELTADGIDCAEQYDGNVARFLSSRSVQHTSIGTIQNNGAMVVSGSNFVQGAPGGAQLDSVARLAQVLIAELPSLGISQSHTPAAKRILREITSELAKPTGDPNMIEQRVSELAEIIANGGPSAITALLFATSRHIRPM
ncbi:hypothetical protein [Dactylosporangium sp. NPDC050588]|uniref:hypothetical protein n=1 Tax=Dactylosporangium sp. NPDC050588 TaxID=3157211 RepID=UPI0033E4C55E